MGVTHDVAGGHIKLLRRSIPVGIWVDEEARLQAFDGQSDLKSRIGWNNGQIRGTDELGTRHVRSGRDSTHWSRVAGTGLDLRAICNRQIKSRTIVDKIIGGRERRSYARF